MVTHRGRRESAHETAPGTPGGATRGTHTAGSFRSYGTLIRGETVCQAIARQIGLLAPLPLLAVAPGTLEAFGLLRGHGVRTAIVSATWEFAVAWFAGRFGADYYVGTGLRPDYTVRHFWPKQKGQWLRELAGRLGVRMKEVAAVGDTAADLELLRVAGRRYFVGATVPAGSRHVRHCPGGNILEIATRMLAG